MERFYISMVLLMTLAVHLARAGKCDNFRGGEGPAWTFHAGSCYHFSKDDKLGWVDAEFMCNLWNASLVEINNEEESTYLQHMYTKIGWKTDDVWVGGSDMLVESNWRWAGTGQEITWFNWDKNQPSNGKLENCLETKNSKRTEHNGKWNDDKCGNVQRYVCEGSAPQEFTESEDVVLMFGSDQ